METHTRRRMILVIVLLAAMCVVAARQPGIRQAAELGVVLRLPDRLGDYSGDDLLYCRNEKCLRQFLSRELDGATVCPACGNALSPKSLEESVALPPDTMIVKKLYTDSADHRLLVTIVASGSLQRSIHRPQQCLPAQGYTIEGSRVIDVPLDGRPPLKVMLLDLRRTGDGPVVRSAYAYWFVGIGRETHSHLSRLWWMAVDRTFSNVMQRWAYVAVAVERDTEAQEHVKQLVECIAELHPQIVRAAAGPPPSSAVKPPFGSVSGGTNTEGQGPAPSLPDKDTDFLAELFDGVNETRGEARTPLPDQ